MNQLLICYCHQSVPSLQFPNHAYSCTVRYTSSPIRDVVESLAAPASLEQLQVMLEELNLEWSKTDQLLQDLSRKSPPMPAAMPVPARPQPTSPRNPAYASQYPQPAANAKPAYSSPNPQPTSPDHSAYPSRPAYPSSSHSQVSLSSSQGAIQCTYCSQSVSLTSAVFPDCGHILCPAHVQAAFNATFMKTGEVKCPVSGCVRQFSQAELRKVVGHAEFERFNTLLCTGGGGTDSVTTCGNCSTTFLFEEGDVEANRVDSEGHKLTDAAARHRSMYRIRCPVCTHISCRNCKAEPYHDGRTCEEQKVFLESKKCRYCDKVVGRELEICSEEECQKRYQRSCKKVLPCNHRCYGTARDETCPPCLNDACGHDPNEHDFCSICYTEGLGMQPVVELECGHFLHSECLNDSLKSRWSGPRITFTYARCPQCKAWALPKNHQGLKEDVMKAQTMFTQIQARALEQLRLDKDDTNPRLTDPTDKNYYNQPERYAMDRYCFYECFKCKKWYYGGKKDCGQNDDGQKYEPKDLICPSCSAVALGGQSSCPTHGTDYIEFKCRFCCAVAAWFCWGTTHFCNDCHTKQNNKIYLNKMPKDQLPQCPGPAQCPLHIQHPPTGDEYPLGCAICREVSLPK